QWDGKALRIRSFSGWNTIKAHPGVEFWDLDAGDDGQGATHTEPHDGGPAPTRLQVLHSPTHVLFCGAYPVEPGPAMVRFVRISGDSSFIEIWRQGVKASSREAIAYPTDLVVESPPFLDDHNVFRTAGGCGQITRDTPTVRGFVLHGLAHVSVLLLERY